MCSEIQRCQAAFRKNGYRVERRGGAHADDGIDLVIERDGVVTAVLCKRWKAWKVNPNTVRELLGTITGGHVPHGMILTLRGYTVPARVKAQEYGITIWGEAEILQLLRTVDAEFDPEMLKLLNDRRKYCPRCESEMVLRTAKRGPSAGGRFWSCTRYPVCKCTIAESESESATLG